MGTEFVCFFHSIQGIIPPNWMNHANLMKNSHCSSTKLSGIFFLKLGTLSFTVFPFIVVVTAYCLPPLNTAAAPLCGLAKGFHTKVADTMVALTQVIRIVQLGFFHLVSLVMAASIVLRSYSRWKPVQVLAQTKRRGSVSQVFPALQTKTKHGCTLTGLQWRHLMFVCASVFQCLYWTFWNRIDNLYAFGNLFFVRPFCVFALAPSLIVLILINLSRNLPVVVEIKMFWSRSSPLLI